MLSPLIFSEFLQPARTNRRGTASGLQVPPARRESAGLELLQCSTGPGWHLFAVRFPLTPASSFNAPHRPSTTGRAHSQFPSATAAVAHAADIHGKVVGVADGDTITILTPAKEQVKIRLHGIDAPERKQDFDNKSKQALSDLVFGKEIRVETDGKDRYGRVIGTLLVEGKNVNLALVDMGLAWHYVKYSDSRELAQAQESAKAAQRGLWGASGQIPPWDYRAKKRAPKKPPAGNLSYWLNTGSGVRHNSTCDMFENTKRGRICEPTDGRACGMCGG